MQVLEINPFMLFGTWIDLFFQTVFSDMLKLVLLTHLVKLNEKPILFFRDKHNYGFWD